jgi:hypothetical protein
MAMPIVTGISAKLNPNTRSPTGSGGVPLLVESGQVRAPTGGYYAAAVTA